jgi:hypothetical protein
MDVASTAYRLCKKCRTLIDTNDESIGTAATARSSPHNMFSDSPDTSPRSPKNYCIAGLT